MASAEAVARRKRPGKGKINVGISQRDESRIRARLRGNTGDPSNLGCLVGGIADGVLLPTANPQNGAPCTYLCSEPWVDTCFKYVPDVAADGREIVVRYHDAKAPQPTGTIRCPSCGRKTPQNAFEGGCCLDCRSRRDHEIHGASPSAVAIQAIERQFGRMEEAALPSEKKSDLRREILRWQQTGKVRPQKKYRWRPRSQPSL